MWVEFHLRGFSEVYLKPRKSLPDVGELVVGTVRTVMDMGAYLELDEYGGLQAFLPWSEATSRSVRSIEDVVREGQRVVVKVIRVDRVKKHVDVSLKRVMEGERRRKMAFYKRYVKAASLITLLAEKLGRSVDEAYRDVLWKLEDAYGDPMVGLERAVLEGEQALRSSGIPEYWVEPLLDIARTHVEVKVVRVSGILTVRSTASDGLYRVRSFLLKVRELFEGEPKIKARLYTVGAPRYRVDVEGHDFKTLESTLKRVLEEAAREAEKLGLEFNFERLKE
ncbi:MAG: translation initiation factor IF-2 subunit alpha [Desulfurococcales archaeon]|jgi:translation initiation factor 2 subunit 1|nr:translation initiation factor IF-2 subunit alpha [Desulfurococcaceae archaeon]MCC6060166.1 translation initiation factor IF-2 subunit alpha [Desulfurococcaceae archaeon]MDT7865936.1 translation initiation factor IF-2 subunit alpha [Desulfurococcales archaeon]